MVSFTPIAIGWYPEENKLLIGMPDGNGRYKHTTYIEITEKTGIRPFSDRVYVNFNEFKTRVFEYRSSRYSDEIDIDRELCAVVDDD